MIATVKSLEFNQKLNGKYDITILGVTTDKGEDKKYNIFTNAKYHDVVKNLTKGAQINIKMEKNGKYWNVSDISLLEKEAVPSKTYSESKPSGDKDIAIARAVALKAAVELYSAMISAGLTKKSLKPEAAVEEVFSLTKKFEGYTTLADDLDSLTSDTSSISSEEDGFEETPFPD